MIKPDKFDEILQLLLGMLLVVLGLFHIIYLLLSRNSLDIKGWFFVCPVLVALCGLLSLMVPALRDNVSTVVLLTGICLLLFNLTSLQEYLAERRGRRAQSRPAVEPGAHADDALVETTIPHDEAE
jgi:uncharacterized membrane protein HdeD (DUF308 family)